mmetsp:Transcript_30345/g.98441  ORF Transcript_30345/g.98441 Transcript_30345/m.98441 type:complete len:796 (-) Transcript_30345:158-2545(-)
MTTVSSPSPRARAGASRRRRRTAGACSRGPGALGERRAVVVGLARALLGFGRLGAARLLPLEVEEVQQLLALGLDVLALEELLREAVAEGHVVVRGARRQRLVEEEVEELEDVDAAVEGVALLREVRREDGHRLGLEAAVEVAGRVAVGPGALEERAEVLGDAALVVGPEAVHGEDVRLRRVGRGVRVVAVAVAVGVDFDDVALLRLRLRRARRPPRGLLAGVDDDGEAPVEVLVDGHEEEVLVEDVDVLRPPLDLGVGLLGVEGAGERLGLEHLREEEGREDVDAHDRRELVVHLVLEVEVDQIVVEELAVLEAEAVALEARDRVGRLRAGEGEGGLGVGRVVDEVDVRRRRAALALRAAPRRRGGRLRLVLLRAAALLHGVGVRDAKEVGGRGVRAADQVDRRVRVVVVEEAEDVVGEDARGRAGEVEDDVAVGARVLARVEALAAQAVADPGLLVQGQREELDDGAFVVQIRRRVVASEVDGAGVGVVLRLVRHGLDVARLDGHEAVVARKLALPLDVDGLFRDDDARAEVELRAEIDALAVELALRRAAGLLLAARLAPRRRARAPLRRLLRQRLRAVVRAGPGAAAEDLAASASVDDRAVVEAPAARARARGPAPLHARFVRLAGRRRRGLGDLVLAELRLRLRLPRALVVAVAVGADLDGLLLGLARLVAAALLRRALQRQRRRRPLRRNKVAARALRRLVLRRGRLQGHHLRRLLGAVVAPRRAAVHRWVPVAVGPGIVIPHTAPGRAAPLPGAPPLLLLLLLAPPRGRGVIDGPVVIKLEIVKPAHA